MPYPIIIVAFAKKSKVNANKSVLEGNYAKSATFGENLNQIYSCPKEMRPIVACVTVLTIN